MSEKERKISWGILLELKKRVKALESIALPFASDQRERPTGAMKEGRKDNSFSTPPIEASKAEPSSRLSPKGAERSGAGSEATLTGCEGRRQ